MFRKIGLLLVMSALSIVSLSSAVMAQNEKVIAKGLHSPRNISYASDGTLYIAEAGTGGSESGDGPYGPVTADAKTGVGIGDSGQISSVSPDGKQSIVIKDLVSMNIGFGQVYGPMAVHVTDDSYWLVLGVGPAQPEKGKKTDALVQYSRDGLGLRQVIDMNAFEKDNNPDRNPDDLVSNPSDIAVADDGTIYITDASANALLTWTEKDGLKVFAAWPVQGDEAAVVPTSVAIGPDGEIYVSFLTGFPFQPETSRIEIYSPDGSLKKTYDKLSFVTDLLVTKDNIIYAVEFSDSYGDSGWAGNSGSVVQVSDNGIMPIVENLNFPYGMAMSPDGQLVVTVNSFGGSPDSGRVIALNTGE